MSAQQERFGELRSLLMGKQSSYQWNKICRLLDQWDEDDYFLNVVLPYAVDYLKGWPHDIRLAPQRWVKCAIGGEPTYRMQIATKLSCSRKKFSDKKLCALFSQPGVASITEAVLNDNYAGASFVDVLIGSAYTSNIKKLDLQHNRLGSTAVRVLVQSDWFAHVEVLEIANMLVKDGQDLLAITAYLDAFDHPSCANLKRLNVSWTCVEGDDFLTFVQSEHLQNLVELEMVGLGTDDATRWSAVFEQLQGAPMFSRLEWFTFQSFALGEDAYENLLIEGQFKEEVLKTLSACIEDPIYWKTQ